MTSLGAWPGDDVLHGEAIDIGRDKYKYNYNQCFHASQREKMGIFYKSGHIFNPCDVSFSQLIFFILIQC